METKTVSLAFALKQKNRLAGKIAAVNAVIARENSRLENTTSTVNVEEKFAERKQLVNALIKLKTQISQANISIYSVLAEMEEVKAEIALLESLNVSVEPQREVEYEDGKQVIRTILRVAFITQDYRDRVVAKRRDTIAALQDKVDEFNATTKITIEVS